MDTLEVITAVGDGFAGAAGGRTIDPVATVAVFCDETLLAETPLCDETLLAETLLCEETSFAETLLCNETSVAETLIRNETSLAALGVDCCAGEASSLPSHPANMVNTAARISAQRIRQYCLKVILRSSGPDEFDESKPDRDARVWLLLACANVMQAKVGKLLSLSSDLSTPRARSASQCRATYCTHDCTRE